MEPSPSRPRVAAEAVDLLSSLPAPLLEEILSRVGLRDAVRTSALSRAWRRRWESVPGLDLSFPDGTPPCVVDRVLLLYYTAPRVSRFAFHFDDASASHVGHWLIALSRRSVGSISIRPHPNSSLQPKRSPLHSSIFSCAHLVSLHLELCDIPPIPAGFAGFPVLEELYLTRVQFPVTRHPLDAIIRGSPLLRILSLDDLWDTVVDCMIESPNLHSLTLCSGYDVDWSFGELPCLQNAKIHVSHILDEDALDFGVCLAAVAQVRELTFFTPLDDDIHPGTTLPTFYNLKSLELATRFNAIDHILLMFSLLRSSPNLQKLKMEVEEPEMVADCDYLIAQWTDGMCVNLQIVEIISDPIRRWLPISFMKLVLSKASLLRTLSVDVSLGSQDDPLNELLTCRRASPEAQILFEVQLERFWNL